MSERYGECSKVETTFGECFLERLKKLAKNISEEQYTTKNRMDQILKFNSKNEHLL